MLTLSSIGLLIDWFVDNQILGIYNDKRDGFILTAIVFILLMVTVQTYFVMLIELEYIGYKIRTQCTMLLYKKLLRLNSTSENQTSVGKVVNIVSNDLSRVNKTVQLIGLATQFPVFVAFAIYQVYARMGIAVLATIGGIILFFLLMMWQAVKLGQLREQIAPSTDKRCKATEELVGAMNIVKMYCWESAFLEKIIKNRHLEIALIKKRSYLGHVMHRFLGCSGKMIGILTFVVHFSMITLDEFKSSDLFVVQSFIEELNWQLGVLFWTVFAISEGLVSINRLDDVLTLNERHVACLTENNTKEHDTNIATSNITLQDVTANWPHGLNNIEEKPGKKNIVVPSTEGQTVNVTPFFSNLNLEVSSKSFLGVIGPVGSGKSSFLSIFLKEMTLTGRYNWPEKVAYCPQESWIYIASIRENILIGRPFNSDKYKQVTTACCLLSDFQQLPEKDQTVVGERGVTLSGGQRARINLARAIYGDADLYLLDDPLAAVDTKVAQSIFKNVMLGYLKSKTRILVTHHVDLLEYADQIICFNKHAEVAFNGEYTELCKTSDQFLESLMQKKLEPDNSTQKMQDADGTDLYFQAEKGIDIEEEVKQTGQLGFRFFANYFLLCGRKALVVIWIISLFITQALQVLTDFQMAKLGSSGDELTDECVTQNLTQCSQTVLRSGIVMNEFYIYIGIFMIWNLIGILTVVQYVNITTKTSQNAHDVSIAAVVKTSMDFFHGNPTGRIMNRFTKDMGVLDDVLVIDTNETIYCLMLLFGILVVNVAIMWFSIIVVIPLLIFIMFVRQYYVHTSREVKRLEGIQQSPVFSHFSETMNGRVSINAFQIEDYMLKKTYKKQNDYGAAWIIFVQLNRWLQLRLDFVTAIFFIIISVTFVAIYDIEDVIRLLSLTSATIGLCLSKTWLVLGTTQWLVRKSCECENHLTSLERILEYSLLPDEENINNSKDQLELPVFNRSEAKKNLTSIINRKNVKTDSLESGKIQLKSFCYGYKNNKTVLNNLSVEIQSGEKIGVVGRTGAGKSSLISALFRMRNPQSGNICIANKDVVDDMPLMELRRNLSIIPQEPFIFCDTFRSNIDPLHGSNDEEIWSVLWNVGLSEKVNSCKGGLSYELAAKGANLSAGEKQLLCLARATLKHNKILLIDEATANVDLQTDDFIQQTLTKEFKNATVLTVAHRLKTIIHSDRVIVMEEGRIVEFDAPTQLLQNSKSFFKSLVDSSRDSDKLYAALRLNGTKF